MEDNKGYVITKQQQRFVNGKRMDECVSSETWKLVNERVFLRCYDVRGHDVSELDRAKPLKKINPVRHHNRGDDRGNTPLEWNAFS